MAYSVVSMGLFKNRGHVRIGLLHEVNHGGEHPGPKEGQGTHDGEEFGDKSEGELLNLCHSLHDAYEHACDQTGKQYRQGELECYDE